MIEIVRKPLVDLSLGCVTLARRRKREPGDFTDI